jgi:hypothetical protein
MFEKCLKIYGELELGQCYGLVPALAFGGAALVENVEKMSALEHFGFLCQLGQVDLCTYSKGNRSFLRNLGNQFE